MPSLSPYQLSFMGVLLGPTTDYLIESVDGLTGYDVQSTDEPRPLQDGDYYGQDSLEGKTITVTGTIRGNSDAGAQANMDALKATLRTSVLQQSRSAGTSVFTIGANNLPQLYFALPDGSTRFFRARLRRAHFDTTRLLGRRIAFTLEFRAASGLALGAQTSLSVAQTDIAAGTIFNFALGGDYSSPLLISANGGFTGLTVDLFLPDNGGATPDRTLAVSGSVPSNSGLSNNGIIISSEDRTVQLTSGTFTSTTLANIRNRMTGAFLFGEAGTNRVRITATGTNTGARPTSATVSAYASWT